MRGRILPLAVSLFLRLYRFLRPWLSCGFLLAAPCPGLSATAQESPRSALTQPEKKETSSVSGMVIALSTGEPIKGAIARLKKADDENQGYSAVTDGSGHFQLKEVESGRYRLEVTST